MSDEPLAKQMHQMMADVRAVATSVADPTSGLAQNLALGVQTYERGPEHAVLLASLIAQLRLREIAEIRAGQGEQPLPFPYDELADATIRVPPRRGRPSAAADALKYLEGAVESGAPQQAPIQALIAQHGVLAFMSLVHLANETGRMLVAVDHRFAKLQDLFKHEALVDELEWIDMQGPEASEQ